MELLKTSVVGITCSLMDSLECLSPACAYRKGCRLSVNLLPEVTPKSPACDR